jgi:CelD/BcsL family acetyltransferase involved in cellulose biosynthesis
MKSLQAASHFSESPLGTNQDRSPQSSTAGPFSIRVFSNVEVFLDHLDAYPQQTSRTAFQTSHWLATWYRTIGDNIGEPILIDVLDRRSDALAVALALIRRTDRGLRVIEFADGGVSDNNCPILGPASPASLVESRALWIAIRSALPRADLLRFTKMPAEVAGRPNPLALLWSTRASRLNSNILAIDRGWSEYLKSLERRFRKELGRSWRVFANHPGAAFKCIENPAEATSVLEALERQQLAHLQERGKLHILDNPRVVQFYRSLTMGGLANGNVILTALVCGDDVVAALLGVTIEETYVMVRISRNSGNWSNCSPGRLLIVKTMEMLRARGYRHFDFSIGNYPYKRRLGVQPRPLVDLLVAGSALGVPVFAAEYVKHLVRSSSPAQVIARQFKLHFLQLRPTGQSERD